MPNFHIDITGQPHKFFKNSKEDNKIYILLLNPS